jgi:hypothetical protein
MKVPFEREVAVFDKVRRLARADRAAYLDATCAGDEVLRQRVEQLLSSSEEAGDFLPPLASKPGGAP